MFGLCLRGTGGRDLLGSVLVYLVSKLKLAYVNSGRGCRLNSS